MLSRLATESRTSSNTIPSFACSAGIGEEQFELIVRGVSAKMKSWEKASIRFDIFIADKRPWWSRKQFQLDRGKPSASIVPNRRRLALGIKSPSFSQYFSIKSDGQRPSSILLPRKGTV
jgi:hypothetical protein